MSELPRGWIEIALGEVCDSPSQRKPDADETFIYIDIASVDRLSKKIKEPQLLKGVDAPSRARKIVQTGDILISMTRPNLNAVALVAPAYDKSIASTGFDVLRPLEIEPKWIFAVARSYHFIESMTSKVQGALYPAIKAADIREYKVPLPPLIEQSRIAEKLDELLAQVDTLKARIDRIPAILKRFRQSVLAAAVSGRLTEEWRLNNKTEPIDTLLKNIEEERIRLKKQKQLKQSFGKLQPVESLYLLPDKSWQWVCFDQISRNENNALKAGPFGSSLKKSDCIESGYKVYGQEQVIAGDEELSTYFISDKKFKDLEACAVIPGDILISLVGTIGKVLLLSEKAQAGIINPRLVKLGLNKEINRRYIKAYLDSSYAHGFFKQFSHGGTMEILNLGILKQLPIPLPPVEEQAEIVRRVEQLFAYADQLEAAVNNARARIDRLTQSILAKAFRGELVPQDPNDEPASVLLERIRTERTAQTKPRRNQRKTAD